MANELRVCRVDDLKEGESLRIETQGNMTADIALHRVGDHIYATDDLCTHEKWSLGEDGMLEGHEIVCCLHLAAFDVRDGAATRFPAMVPLNVYPVRIVEGEVWIGLNPK
jgi:nitrite reductase/ring-hydroxylating ferredoxin subunit